jgi:putative nucleotidyltransferase with HDIG domain
MLGSIAELFGRIVDAASPRTMVHSAGVAATAVALAERLKFSPREISLMRAAGFLHDLGKLTVPKGILDNPNALTKLELTEVKSHTYHTFRILDTIGGMPQIREWAAFHHERLDGSGYPFHHKGRDLTLGARILGVADVFTAVTEDRPFRQRMTVQEAISILENLARTNRLDRDVIAVLRRDCEAIDSLRQDGQAEYRKQQEELAWIIKEGSLSHVCNA